MSYKKIIAGLALMLGFILVSCDFLPTTGIETNTETQWSNLIPDRPEVAKSFDTVGVEHNTMLGEIYNELVQYKNLQAKSVSKTVYLSEADIEKVFKNYFTCNNVMRSVENNSSEIKKENEKYQFSEVAQAYIDQIENLTSSQTGNLYDILRAIEQIEKEAELKIFDSEKPSFYSYTATAKASLSYWTANIEKWELLKGEASINEQRGIFDIWKKYRKKIAMAAASDAAGAAVGAGLGAGIGSTIPGVGSVLGATIGATIVGGASSAEGWRTGCFSIVVPLTKVQREIENEGK